MTKFPPFLEIPFQKVLLERQPSSFLELTELNALSQVRPTITMYITSTMAKDNSFI